MTRRERNIIRRARKKYLKQEKKRRRNNFYLSAPWRILRKRVLQTLGQRCCKCHILPKNGQHVHVDHVRSRLKYPSLELIPSNMQVLCKTCNKEKGPRTADYRTNEQLQAMLKLDEDLPKELIDKKHEVMLPEEFEELVPKPGPVVVRSGSVNPPEKDKAKAAQIEREFRKAREARQSKEAQSIEIDEN